MRFGRIPALFVMLAAAACMVFSSVRTAAAASAGVPRTLSINISPDIPMPGEAVAAAAEIEPFDPERHILTWSWKGEGEKFFITRDGALQYWAASEPLTVTAVVADRFSRKELLRQSATVVPASFDVSVETVLPEPASVLTWNAAAQRPAERTGTAAGDIVRLTAKIVPAPPAGAFCMWTSDADTAVISQDKTSCLVRRSSDGIGRVGVTVMINRLTLGSASASFDVAISPDELRMGQELSAGWELWQDALALRERGEADQALLQAERASEHLIAGGADAAFVRAELDVFRSAQDRISRAAKLSSQAAGLWRDGKLEEALSAYTQAAELLPGSDAAADAEAVKAKLKDRETAEAEANAMLEEARGLVQANELDRALELYTKSLNRHFNAAAQAERIDLQGMINARAQRTSMAASRRSSALILESQGDIEGALRTMYEAVQIWPLEAAVKDVSRIEKLLNAKRADESAATEAADRAAALERQAMRPDGTVDIDMLSRALGEFEESLKLSRNDRAERGASRVRDAMDAAASRRNRAGALMNEAAGLEKEGKFGLALELVRRSLLTWRSDEAESKIKELTGRIEQDRAREEKARGIIANAQALEREGRFQEALNEARRAEETASLDIIPTTIKHLRSIITDRSDRAARAAALAEMARASITAGNKEEALKKFIESHAVWPTNSVSQDIRSLEALIDEETSRHARAEALRNEAVMLRSGGKFSEAAEKLRESLTFDDTQRTRDLLTEIGKDIDTAQNLELLRSAPFKITGYPRIPHVGAEVEVRIESGPWTTVPGVSFSWKADGSVSEDRTVEGGRAYRFYAADTSPVTASVTAQWNATGEIIARQNISFMPESRSLRIIMSSASRAAQVWDDSEKTLKEITGFTTSDDVEFFAEITPIPPEQVSYVWECDPGITLVSTRGSSAVFRHPDTGTGEVRVTALDPRGIALGSSRTIFTAATDRLEVERGQRQARAWTLWLEAQTMWESGQFSAAIKTAETSLSLNANSHEAADGLLRMKSELDRMIHAARMMADASESLAAGDTAAVRSLTAQAAESLGSSAVSRELRRQAEELRYAAEASDRNAELRRLEAERLMAASARLLADGRKADALACMRVIYSLSPSETLSGDIAALDAEVTRRAKAESFAMQLREKARSNADRRRYAEAAELYEESLQYLPDSAVSSYVKLLKDRAEEERESRARAEKLRKNGDDLLRSKRPRDAVRAYKSSLSVWFDAELDKTVKNMEKEHNEADAKKLRTEAEALIKAKKQDDAAEKYRESLKLAYDKTAANFVAKADAKKASDLVREADTLLKSAKADELPKRQERALGLYKRALQLSPKDKTISVRFDELNRIVSKNAAVPSEEVAISQRENSEADELDSQTSEQKRGSQDASAKANALVKEANALFKSGDYEAALKRYEEAYALNKTPKLSEFIAKLKDTLRARELVREANVLFRDGKRDEALVKYRESLKFQKNPEVEKFISTL